MLVGELWGKLGLDTTPFDRDLPRSTNKMRVAASTMESRTDSVTNALRTVGRQAGQSFGKQVPAAAGKADRSLEAVQDRLRRLAREADQAIEIDVDADTTKARVTLEAFEQKEERDVIHKKVDIDVDRVNSSLDRYNKTLGGGIIGTETFSKVIGLIKWPAMIQGANLAAGAIGAAAGAAGLLVSSLAPLSGLIVAYPAIYGAAAQAMGVFKLATSGVTEAIKLAAEGGEEFREAMKDLPPAARPVVEELAAMQPLLDRLQKTAAEGVLGGLEDELKDARRLFPIVNRVVGDTSVVIGDLIERGAKMATAGPFRRDLVTIGEMNVDVIRNFGRAGLTLADAMRHIVIEAEPLVEWLSRSAMSFADNVRDAAAAGRASGDLADFFEDTKDAAGDLAEVLGNVGRTLLNINKAAAPFGEDLLDRLVKLTQGWEDFTGSIEGQNAMTDYFEDARPVMDEVGLLVRDVFKLFGEMSQDTGVAQMIGMLRTDLLPIFSKIAATTSGEFGPALIDLAAAFGDFFAILTTETGALTTVVKSMANLLEVVNNIIEAVPGLDKAIYAFAALSGTMRALNLTGLILGFGSLNKSMAGTAAGAGRTGGALGLIGTKVGMIAALGVAAINVGRSFGRAAEEADELVDSALDTGQLGDARKRIDELAKATVGSTLSFENMGGGVDAAVSSLADLGRMTGDVLGLLGGDPLEASKFDALKDSIRGAVEETGAMTRAAGRLQAAQGLVLWHQTQVSEAVAEYGKNSPQAIAATEQLTEAEDELAAALKDEGVARAELLALEETELETRRRLAGVADEAISAELDLRDARRELGLAQARLSRLEERGMKDTRAYTRAQEDVTRAELGLRGARRRLSDATKALGDELEGTANAGKKAEAPFRRLAESFGLNKRQIENLLGPGARWRDILKNLRDGGKLTKDQMAALRIALGGLQGALTKTASEAEAARRSLEQDRYEMQNLREQARTPIIFDILYRRRTVGSAPSGPGISRAAMPSMMGPEMAIQPTLATAAPQGRLILDIANRRAIIDFIDQRAGVVYGHRSAVQGVRRRGMYRQAVVG